MSQNIHTIYFIFIAFSRQAIQLNILKLLKLFQEHLHLTELRLNIDCYSRQKLVSDFNQ